MMRVLSWLLLAAMLALATFASTQAQDAPADPLADPVVRGAWLYAGNCVRCHGAYAEARLGEDKRSKTLKAEISGDDRQGCDIDWSISRDGSLTVKEISALVTFIEAWEEQGSDLSLPPLPPQPTPTPKPSPTVATAGDKAAAPLPTTPTATPLPPDLQLALDSNPIARGAWLYAQNCYRCHQDYATGRMGVGLERDRIERTIQGGKIGSNMPAFAINQGGTLRATDIKLIVNYIEAFEQLGVAPALPAAVLQTMVQPLDPVMLAPIALPTAPVVQGDGAYGALLFRAYCAPCHGVTGDGGSGPPLARVWDSVRPDLTLRAMVAQEVSGTPMRGWAQPHGGPFDDAALDAVVTYLLTLPPALTLTQSGAPAATPLLTSPWQGWRGLALLLVAISGIGVAVTWGRTKRTRFN